MMSSRQQTHAAQRRRTRLAISSCALPSHTSVPWDRPEMRSSSSIVVGCVSSSIPRTNDRAEFRHAERTRLGSRSPPASPPAPCVRRRTATSHVRVGPAEQPCRASTPVRSIQHAQHRRVVVPQARPASPARRASSRSRKCVVVKSGWSGRRPGAARRRTAEISYSFGTNDHARRGAAPSCAFTPTQPSRQPLHLRAAESVQLRAPRSTS